MFIIRWKGYADVMEYAMELLWFLTLFLNLAWSMLNIWGVLSCRLIMIWVISFLPLLSFHSFFSSFSSFSNKKIDGFKGRLVVVSVPNLTLPLTHNIRIWNESNINQPIISWLYNITPVSSNDVRPESASITVVLLMIVYLSVHLIVTGWYWSR